MTIRRRKDGEPEKEKRKTTDRQTDTSGALRDSGGARRSPQGSWPSSTRPRAAPTAGLTLEPSCCPHRSWLTSHLHRYLG